MSRDFVTAFAPASIGNLGVGFDVLGLAIAGAGDKVSARRMDNPGVHISDIRAPDGNYHGGLSSDPAKNTALIAAAALWQAHGDGGGLELEVRKGVPLQSGMGSSAASAVAGAVAANALLPAPLPLLALLPFALAGEKFASNGLHADNVAPSLLGGLVLCPPGLLPDVVQIPPPNALQSVLLHPDLEVNTAESRGGLAKQVATDAWITQQGNLSCFIAACYLNDVALMRRTLRDDIIEPQRQKSVPCFPAVKKAAIDANAIGSSLSGSGPAIFALCEADDAESVAAAMAAACRESGVECRTWISAVDAPGAHIVDGG